jgi:hypothetical protein
MERILSIGFARRQDCLASVLSHWFIWELHGDFLWITGTFTDTWHPSFLYCNPVMLNTMNPANKDICPETRLNSPPGTGDKLFFFLGPKLAVYCDRLLLLCALPTAELVLGGIKGFLSVSQYLWYFGWTQNSQQMGCLPVPVRTPPPAGSWIWRMLYTSHIFR